MSPLKQTIQFCYPRLLKNTSEMETKEISPVFKRDRRLIKTKYRPLTILPSLSKVFEIGLSPLENQG